MAVNKPVKKGTRQTEERARGLVGWKNGRQVTTSKDAVANKNVGDYKARKGKSGKTLNLTNKQLGASGRRAASAATVDISKTTFDKSKGGVLGPMGKPLTGRVDLGGGNIAVYRNGVRVRASSKSSGGGGGGRGGGDNPKPPSRTIRDRGPALQAERKPRAKPYIQGPGRESPKSKPSRTQLASRANPYLGGRAQAVSKQKDGSYSTASNNKGTTARGALMDRVAQNKRNEGRDNAFLAALALAPLLAAGGVAGGAGAGIRGIMAARGGLAARSAAAARTSAPAARAALPKAMTRATPTGTVRAQQISSAASRAGVKVKPTTKPPTKPKFVANSSRPTGRAGEIERGLKAQMAKKKG